MTIISPFKADKKKRSSTRLTSPEWNSLERLLAPPSGYPHIEADPLLEGFLWSPISHPDTEINPLEGFVRHINVDPIWLTINIKRLDPAAVTTDSGFKLIAIVHISYDPYTMN